LIDQIPPNEPKQIISELELTEILKTIGIKKHFIDYANKHGNKNYICDTFDSEKLTHGFCNPLSYYLKDRYVGLSVYSAKNEIDGNHLFIKFKNKYYDASNVYGVRSPFELDFFTSKKNITIKLLEA